MRADPQPAVEVDSGDAPPAPRACPAQQVPENERQRPFWFWEVGAGVRGKWGSEAGRRETERGRQGEAGRDAGGMKSETTCLRKGVLPRTKVCAHAPPSV